MRPKRLPFALFAVAFVLAGNLCAADFWESKPISEWSDKDMQKLVSNSPWAHSSRGSVSNSATDGLGDAASSPGPSGLPPVGAGGSANPGVNRSAGDLSPIDSAAQAGAGMPDVSLTVRWLTALPMRQAQMRAKYGKEAGTSPEATKYIEQEPSFYTLGIAGLPGLLVSAYGGDRAKDLIQKQTTLTAKGKEPLRPVAIQFVANGGTVDVLVAFPRTPAFAIADQEVDLISRIGTVTVRQRFRLKDMQVRGKLEL